MSIIIKYGKWILIALVGLFLLINVIKVINILKPANNEASDLIIAQALVIDSSKTKIDSLTYALSNQLRRTDTLWRERKSHTDTAWVFNKSADSLVLLAATDTVRRCMLMTQAYNERTSECAQLKLALQSDSVSIKSSDNIIKFTVDTLRSVSTKLARATFSLDSIAKKSHCSFICPSRTMSFLLGSGLTFITMRITK